MDTYFGDLRLVRLLFQRSLAGVCLIAFVVALNQFRALLGEHGLLPVPEFVRAVPFAAAPSVFHLHYSDRFFALAAWAGIAVSSLALLGITERGPWWVGAAAWLFLWALYLSIVNVGQTFYAFGWESMLVEACFFSAFMGPARCAPSIIPILIVRWMLFRLEFGSGLIKLRGDECWRNLTCLFYHFETQPLPNPLSWYFHHLPPLVQVCGVAFSHGVQLLAPFGLFARQPVASVCCALILSQQFVLIASGNYAWLNWLTVVIGVCALSDGLLARALPLRLPPAAPRGAAFDGALWLVAALTVFLSLPPLLNFLSPRQRMNYSWNPLQIANSYGAFGSVTKERYEIVVEGTAEPVVTPATRWREYGFRAKPGDVMRRPPQIAPYHLRLDWLMWFLPFSVAVGESGIAVPGYEPWFIAFVDKLLEGDAQTLSLLRSNPFPEAPPRFIRARFYRYRFTSAEERRGTGAWWERTLIDDYLPPVSREATARLGETAWG